MDFPATSLPIAYRSVFHEVSTFVFNNDATIVIKGTNGSETHYEYGYTDVAANVLDPTTNSASVKSDYQDGLTLGTIQSAPYLVPQVAPKLTIKAIGTKPDGSPNSSVVSATFDFETGNPNVIGDNAAQFYVSDITTGAELYYTTDGSTPSSTNANATHLSATNLLSSTNAWQIGFPITTNTTFKAVAVRANYQDSAVVSTTFSPSNFVANTISFGFVNGEASSDFVASPGQMFYAPVTLSILSGTKIYSMQFNVTVTNLGSNAVAPGQFDFTSMLMKPIPGEPGLYEPIPPYGFASFTPPAVLTNASSVLALNTAKTFNSVTVDGDTSTNDTCLLFATGASGAARISRASDPRLTDFKAKLEAVMLDLAIQLVRDG